MQRIELYDPKTNTKHSFNIDTGMRLGNGVFGDVFKGENQDTHATVAIKRLSIGSSENYKTCKIEISIQTKLSGVDASNIIQIQGVFNKKNSPYAYIAMTYAVNGSLLNRINSTKLPTFELPMQIALMRGIANGLAYMHLHNIVHCDLKPANILLDEKLEPQICDFGLSKRIDEDDLSEIVGTPLYTPPEHLDNSYDKKHSQKTDMYSYGLVSWNIAAHQDEPYSWIINLDDLIDWVATKKKRVTIPNHVPKELASLIEQEWAQDPADRPAASEVRDKLDKILATMHPTPVASAAAKLGMFAEESLEKIQFIHAFIMEQVNLHNMKIGESWDYLPGYLANRPFGFVVGVSATLKYPYVNDRFLSAHVNNNGQVKFSCRVNQKNPWEALTPQEALKRDGLFKQIIAHQKQKKTEKKQENVKGFLL